MSCFSEISQNNLRRKPFLLFSLLILLYTCVHTGRAGTERSFQNKQGETIVATFVQVLPDGLVEIKRTSDGEIFQVPIVDLSLDDQQYLSSLLQGRKQDSESSLLFRFEDRSLFLDKAGPGKLEISGGEAFSFLVGKEDPEQLIGAASLLGKGRVVALTHPRLGVEIPMESPGGRGILLNALRWTTGKAEPKVLLTGSAQRLEIFLRDEGFPCTSVRLEEIEVEGHDVVVIAGQLALPEEKVEKLKNFVREGGALVIATVPWATAGKYENFEADFPGNRLLEGSGLRFMSKSGFRGKEAEILGGNPIVIE